MRHKTEGNLNHVVALLRKMARQGTLEPEQLQAITIGVCDLRKAYRARDLVKLRTAVDRVVRIFLNTVE